MVDFFNTVHSWEKQQTFKNIIVPTLESSTTSTDKAASIGFVKAVFEGIESKIFDSIFPVGTIYTTVERKISNGEIQQPFTQGTWKRIGQGHCLFGANDSDSSLEAELSPSLPNITGNIQFNTSNSFDVSDLTTDNKSLVVSTKQPAESVSITYKTTTTKPNVLDTISIDASRSNTIYDKNTTTVQPPAITVDFWKRES